MGTQSKPPNALDDGISKEIGKEPGTGPTAAAKQFTHIISTLMLLVWLTVPTLTPHASACTMIVALPAAEVKSAQKAPQAIVKRMEFFFQDGQLSGSEMSLVGWGRRTVWSRRRKLIS